MTSNWTASGNSNVRRDDINEEEIIQLIQEIFLVSKLTVCVLLLLLLFLFCSKFMELSCFMDFLTN